MMRFGIWQKVHFYRPAMFRHSGESFATKRGDVVAEHTAAALGSWRFIGAQAFVMLLWVLVNTLAAFAFMRYDPFPFVFLNLAMSAEAAYTGPILLIAANVAAMRDHAQWERIERLEATMLARMDKQDAANHQILKNQAAIMQWMASQGASHDVAN